MVDQRTPRVEGAQRNGQGGGPPAEALAAAASSRSVLLELPPLDAASRRELPHVDLGKIVLESPSSLLIEIEEPSGRRVLDATVTATLDDDRPPLGFLGTVFAAQPRERRVTTPGDGTYLLERIPSGWYEVRAAGNRPYRTDTARGRRGDAHVVVRASRGAGSPEGVRSLDLR